jgi:superfamily II DNA/RNA helicase
VINYDIPETSELFVHRVGRTGRMGRSGQAITIIAATDLSKIREIERDLNRRFPRIPAPPDMPMSQPKATRPKPVEVMAEPESPASELTTATKPRRRRRPRGGGSKPEGQLATSGA